MIIRVADNAGFCFGVKRATGALEKEIESAALSGAGRRICTLGRIIHNDRYVSEIKSRGVEEIDRGDIDSVIRDAERGGEISVLIRAHGELKSLVSALEKCEKKHPNFRLLDCTCPYVRKVREIAEQNSGDGRCFMLMGMADHPEVEGIMSCASGEKYVIDGYESLEKWSREHPPEEFENKILTVAAQTTFNQTIWKKSMNFIRKVYTNAIVFDTICSVTQIRQEEASRLAEDSDVMIVIGSPDSSNSCKLRDIAQEKCRKVSDISECPDLPDENIKLSITAGASTPFKLIQEVYSIMNEQNENFAELLESSLKTLNTGEIVEGIITSITPTEIHVDLGTKTTGVIAHDKATDDPQAKLDQIFKVGDTIKAKVIKVSDIDGIATLDKTRVDSEANWEKIVEASKSGETLEGKVVEAVNGGVIISVNSVRVFIPASLTGIPRDGDIQELVNTVQKVKIIEIKPERKRAYASIRAVQSEERRAKREEFWNNIQEGMEFDGTVKSLTDFGAFVDLGGVDGMVHNSELSWRRIRSPKEVVSIGDKIHVFVKSFDREKGRISLGYKTDEMNPWTIFKGKYSEGDVAEVKIVSLMPFGAFAEIVPGCDGLIHISQIADHKINKPDDVLSVGQVVEAKITAIDDEKHKVSLSIRALIEKPVEEGTGEDESTLVYSDDEPVAEFAEAAEAVAEEVKETVEEAVETVEETVKETVEEAAEKAEETVAAVEDTVKEAAEEAAETAAETVEKAEEAVAEVAEEATEKAEEAVSGVAEAVEKAVSEAE